MDEPAPLSQSRVWALQRAFYEDNASEAFAEIPHQIVDNPFVAAAFARVVGGFLRDCGRGTRWSSTISSARCSPTCAP